MITDEEFQIMLKDPEFAAFAKKCLEMGLDPKAVPSFTKEFKMLADAMQNLLEVKYGVSFNIVINIEFLGPKVHITKEVQELTPNLPQGGVGG
jgi:hypothetical protein